MVLQSRPNCCCQSPGFADAARAGNVSNVKSAGEGVLEQKVDFGPGYRIYFGRDGDRVILLLGGGTKHRQQRDIADAIERWRDYKARKKET